MAKKKVNLFWLRRDLRLHDNVALARALQGDLPVVPLFIFDPTILKQLKDPADRRVEFIHNTLVGLDRQLKDFGSRLTVLYNEPLSAFHQILRDYDVQAVFTNHDYEPYAVERDGRLARFFSQAKVQFHTSKDQVIFEKNDIVKDDGKPYSIFTPYSRKWKSKLTPVMSKQAPSWKGLSSRLLPMTRSHLLKIEDIGFQQTGFEPSPSHITASFLKAYAKNRDFPSLNATSRLGLHLRFGTVSIREVVKQALQTSETWLNELIWREFFMMVLYHFPHTVEEPYRSEYRFIKWRNNQSEFERWCEGQTGYPLVDAGMRELNETGFMHNRVRMVVASFLCKHLLIHWTWGERYFAQKLLDFDLASNVGNWQWAAGTGCDAAPYFRVFNPSSQQEKFDREHTYIRKWVPELNTQRYPSPIVEHKSARERALSAYKASLTKARH